jgi:antitoxin VapB
MAVGQERVVDLDIDPRSGPPQREHVAAAPKPPGPEDHDGCLVENRPRAPHKRAPSFGHSCHQPVYIVPYPQSCVYVRWEVWPMDAPMAPLTTRVFMNGNSQAVRIPAQLRIDADRVEISRTPDGDLLLHPVPLSRGRALLEVLEGFDEEFVAMLEQSRAEQLPMQERESL